MGGPVAFIKIVAVGVKPWGSDPRSCDVRATLHVRPLDQQDKETALGHNANADFDIVDWSPHDDLILISSERWFHSFSAPYVIVYNVPNNSHRVIDVAGLFHALGWVGCSAIIDTSGFTSDGRIAVITRPGARRNRPKDCVSSPSYWAFDLQKLELHQLPADFQQRQYGKVISPYERPCKKDPDIVDSCFMVHGRIQYGNGTPSLRIWRIGTNRMLGVFDPENEIIPDNLATQLTGFGVAVFGDFEVCPFTKSQPDAMQMVCVESARHLVTEHY